MKTGLFHHKTTMGSCPDLATAECEISALVEETKDAVLLSGILHELHQSQLQPIPTYNDNQSSIHLGSTYSGNHRRVRYMLPKLNWLIEKVKSTFIKLIYLSTDKLPVDLGTKIHTGISHRRREQQVMGH